MRTALLAALLAVAALPATGCIFGCGAYEGQRDQVYARGGAEMMILCENGGFVANLSSSTLEGKFMRTADAEFGVGPDGQLAFDFIANTDGTVSTPQLGDGAWTSVNMDMTALDHANVQCNDLTTRTWWTSL